jgi:hypothetical protein
MNTQILDTKPGIEVDLALVCRGLVALAQTPPSSGGPSPLERAEALAITTRTLIDAGVPAGAAWDAARADKRETKALAAVMGWARWPAARKPWDEVEPPAAPRESGTLVLAGPLGTGKTAAAASFLVELQRAGRQVGSWLSCVGLASRPKFPPKKGESELDPRDGPPLSTLAAALVAAPCLVVDDLGCEGSRDPWVDQWLAAIIGKRNDARKLTIITTNGTTRDIAAIIGARQVDRLTQPDAGEIVVCDGASLRLTVARGGLPPEIEAAWRLAQLVRRLAGTPERRPDPMIDVLPLDEVARQLCRLLTCPPSKAAAWGKRDQEVAAAQRDELDRVLAAMRARPRAPSIDELDRRARAEHQRKTFEALEADESEDPEARAGRRALGAKLRSEFEERQALSARVLGLLEQGEDETPAEVADRKRIAANLERGEAKRR